MNFKEIEKKWQKKWKETKLYSFDETNLNNKYYMLEMFSYPSGAKLHLGHWWNYGLSDSYARFKRMQGFNVFHPMGFDAFGLPAENYAIKTGVHPSDSTHHNIDVMEEQLKNIGGTFDWNYEIKTCDDDYYKWTQWLFLQLYKNGLAYQKYAPVNWCTSCNTVLANEQVVNGVCERCGKEVIKKNLTQWFFKITDYCEKLLEGLDKIDWPEHTKTLQKNWIGKSVGAEVDFSLECGEKLTVFTSRVDTLFGVSFVVIAPENGLVKKLTTPENIANVEKYILEASKKDEIERTSTVKEKTGVFTGSYAINPINNEKVPVFVADYVLNNYGTGCVMGVAAHDDRDFDFAKKYNLKIQKVVEGGLLPFCEDGTLVNSGKFDGYVGEQAREQIVKELELMGKGRKKTNYKLRDWSVSRQRYWGCPIPIIYCEHCGIVPVPEKDLPVKLPYNVEWAPDGKSPLAKNEEYINCICPVCGRPAKRDADTLDTYTCSSWYQLRYPSAKNNKEAFNSDFTNKMMPVDKYVGGIEHATGHLLYSRFITKALHDMGYINFDEPFKSLVHQGIILGPDGNRMSKSRGNTVSADELVNEYGSDALRLYLMFGFNYIDGGPWNDEGIKSISKFIERVERIIENVFELENGTDQYKKPEEELDFVRNNTIKEVNKDFEVFSFNTCIARIMELVNAMYRYLNEPNKNVKFFKEVCLDLIKLLAPAMPHSMEELWEKYGQKYSIFNEKFPTADESKLVKSTVELVVQVNSKIIDRIELCANSNEEETICVALKSQKVAQNVEGKNIVKTIFVQNRLLNLIVK